MVLPVGLFGAVAHDVQDDIGLEDGISDGFKKDGQGLAVDKPANPCNPETLAGDVSMDSAVIGFGRLFMSESG